MAICDLAFNPLASGSGGSVLGYSAAATTEGLELEIYNFLIKPIRDADQTEGRLFVKRFLEGPQLLWREIQDTILRIPELWDMIGCPDAMLQYFKNIVGWTKQLSHITDQMDNLALRRLIATSAQLWKTRSTETSIENILRLAFAKRLRIWNWFDLRIILDEVELGEEREGTDPYMIDYPGEGECPENWMTVHIVDPGVDQRVLVKDLLRLMRPAGERFEVVYLKFLDLFEQDGDTTQWDVGEGGPFIVEGGAGKLTDVAGSENAHTNGTDPEDWAGYSAVCRLRTNDATSDDNGAGLFVYWNEVTGEGYYAQLNVKGNKLVMGRVDSFVKVPLATVDLSTLGWVLHPDVWYTLRMNIFEEGGAQTVQAIVDNTFIASFSSVQYTKGRVALQKDIEIAAEWSEVEVLPLPVEFDTIEINT